MPSDTLTTQIDVFRLFSAVAIEHGGLRLSLAPTVHKQIAVHVDTLPTETLEHGVRVSGESRKSFSPDSITIAGSTLVCLEPTDFAPQFRDGYAVDLAPEVIAEIRRLLPLLTDAATLAHDVWQEMNRHVAPGRMLFQHDFVETVACAMVVFNLHPSSVVDALCSTHHAAKDDVFMRTFLDPSVQALINREATDRRSNAI